MQKRFWIGLFTLMVCLVSAPRLMALRVVPITVEETPVPGTAFTQYTLVNDTNSTATPFSFTVFAASTNGSTPSTTNTGWNAEALNATLWAQPITTGVPSWQTYTGLTYTQAFPNNPVFVNGYYSTITYDSTSGDLTFFGNPVAPGTSLTSFYFVGPPDSSFIIAGPTSTSSPQPLSDIQTFTGTTLDLPEPGAVMLAGMIAAAGLIIRPRRGAVSERIGS